MAKNPDIYKFEVIERIITEVDFTTKEEVVIEDCYDGDAVSLIHLSSEADINKIKIEGAKNIEIFDTKYSVEYNRFIINQTIVIHFNGKMNYRISC